MSQLIPIGPREIVTMTSLEIVDFINDLRKEDALKAGAAFPSPGFAKLEHKDFLEKVSVVLGEETSAEFSADLPDSYGRARRGYRFPKREASLMAMSYSYKIQARVWDHMTALEEELKAKEAATLEQPTKPARVRGRTALEQVKVINFVGDALKVVPGIRLDVVAAAKLQAFEQHTGIDFSEFRRALPPVALDRMVHLNPTQIGARIAEQTGRTKVSSQFVNKVLLELGLQRKVEDGYVLTEAGTKYGEVLPFKAKNAHHGNQIDWWEAVVDVVRENMPAADGKRGNGGSVIPLKPKQSPDEPQASLL